MFRVFYGVQGKLFLRKKILQIGLSFVYDASFSIQENVKNEKNIANWWMFKNMTNGFSLFLSFFLSFFLYLFIYFVFQDTLSFMYVYMTSKSYYINEKLIT